MKTVEEKWIGEALVRLLENAGTYTGAVFNGGKLVHRTDGDDPDAVMAAAVAASLKTAGGYVGYEGARARFLKHFPKAFADPAYFERERSYKLEAKARLDRGAPLELALNGDAACCDGAALVFGTNMLSRFENARARECLRSPSGPAYLRGAALLAGGEHKAGFHEMEAALRPFGHVSWPLVTFLPYLWRPSDHMFLKPEATLHFATSVGDEFPRRYEPRPNADTYAALSALVLSTEAEIADLSPQDRIDVQSYIWVVGAY